MASMSLRFKRLVAIFGASVALAAGVAQAQQVFISIQQITCLRKTAGEQHSDSSTLPWRERHRSGPARFRKLVLTNTSITLI